LQHSFRAEPGTLAAHVTRMTRLVVGLICAGVLSCSQSTPPVDTPATLPPAEPPADVTRDSPDKAADAGKPEQQTETKPVEKP